MSTAKTPRRRKSGWVHGPTFVQRVEIELATQNLKIGDVIKRAGLNRKSLRKALHAYKKGVIPDRHVVETLANALGVPVSALTGQGES